MIMNNLVFINKKNMKNNKSLVSEVKLTYKTKSKMSELKKITSSSDAYNILISLFDSDLIEYREMSKIMMLNRDSRVLGVLNISEGGTTSTIMDIRMIMQAALISNAVGIILCHNHPSGNYNPSKEDDRITENVKKACEIMNIQLLDHLIITTEDYFSYADNSRII